MMAYVMSKDNIPQAGDIVTCVKMTSVYGEVVDVYFDNGKSIAAHICSDDRRSVIEEYYEGDDKEEVLKKFDEWMNNSDSLVSKKG